VTKADFNEFIHVASLFWFFGSYQKVSSRSDQDFGLPKLNGGFRAITSRYIHPKRELKSGRTRLRSRHPASVAIAG
jgi:hypothetical protein